MKTFNPKSDEGSNLAAGAARIGASDMPLRSLGAWWREVWRRQPHMSAFALLMLLLMLPTLVAHGLDERMLRGAGIWLKPLKFMASLAVFSITTAWFVGLLPPQRRRSALVRGLGWTIVIAGGLEIAYICWQAALGQASHYNSSDALHRTLYLLMGAGAMALMLTQPLLAWQIARHGDPQQPALWRQAVVTGLLLTFVLGVSAAALLSSARPPDALAGQSLPLLGWSLSGGDMRPAHFIGSHAQQFVPLMGWALMGLLPRQPVMARWALAAFVLAYCSLWAWAFWVLGLSGIVWMPPV